MPLVRLDQLPHTQPTEQQKDHYLDENRVSIFPYVRRRPKEGFIRQCHGHEYYSNYVDFSSTLLLYDYVVSSSS